MYLKERIKIMSNELNLTREEKEFFEKHQVPLSSVVSSDTPMHLNSIYSVYDRVSKSFEAPFIAVSHDCAKRTLVDVIFSRDSLLQRHPEDYDLYYLGLFDKQRGLCYGTFPNELISNLKDLLPKSGNQVK